MGSACSKCCTCGDPYWTEHVREFKHSKGMFICATHTSNSSIVLKWYETDGRRTHFVLQLKAQDNGHFVHYVCPPVDTRMTAFQRLKPGTVYAIQFCNREVGAWSNPIYVETVDGLDESSPMPLCVPGIPVQRRVSATGRFIPTSTTNPSKNFNPYRCKNLKSNRDSFEYSGEFESSDHDEDSNAEHLAAEKRPLLRDYASCSRK